MQSMNISNLNDNKLQTLANKIPEIKHTSVFSINNTLMKLRSIPITSWSSKKGKFITIGTPVTVIIILHLVTTLYCKCL